MGKMSVKYGISAINWVNEDIKEYGYHYTADQVLEEISSLGYEGTEFSRTFPRDTVALKKLMGAYGMELTSQWKSVRFADPSLRTEEMAAFRAHADFLKAMGCRYVVTCEAGNTVEHPADDTVEVIPLSDAQWQHLVDGLHEAGRYCQENGMQLVYHFHGETVVESREEIARLMASTDPELVHMLYDSGHAYYGGSDPLQLLNDYYDRIRYIHLKDVRDDVLQRKRHSGVRFRTAVREGIFTVPGDGCIDFRPIMEQLSHRGYEGWIIVEAEQNPDDAAPMEYARQAKAYLEQLAADLA